jgi:flagellar motor switch protein FliM
MELSKDQVRVVEKLHGDLAKKMSDYYTEIQGCVIDVEVAFVDITTFAEFIMSLANPSGSYTFNIHPWDGVTPVEWTV